MRAAWTAIVLAGGRGLRLGALKSEVRIADATLLERMLAAIDAPVIVAGDAPPGVRAVRESPRFGGPAAGLSAALRAVETELIAVLAVDMPFAAPLLSRLVEALAGTEADAVVAFDGRPQPLCAAYRAERLRKAIDERGGGDGLSMHALLEGLLAVHYAVDPRLMLDVDTPADLERAQERIRSAGAP